MLRYMTVVGALCAGCAPFLSGGVHRPEVDATVIGLAAGVVLAAAMAVRGGRPVRVVAAVAGSGLAVAVWWLLVSDLLIGLTGHDLPVLAVGSLTVTVGAVEAAARHPVGWRVRPVGVAAVVLVAVAAFLAPAGAEAVIVRSDTRDARDFDPPPVVERPGGRQWAWQPPADVAEIAPILHGVAVATRDGAVVALNGTDGRVEWRYARPGAPVGAVVASIDRRTVVAAFRSANDPRAQEVVVLDADTGEPRFELVVRSLTVQNDQMRPGPRMLTVRDGEVITGYDIVNGAPRWRWSPPAGCTALFGLVVWGPTTVLAPVECPETLGVTALDEATGQERWRHEVRRGEAGGERQDVRLRALPDGSAVLLQTFGALDTPDAVADGLFDTETGRLLSRPERPWTVRMDAGVAPMVEEQEGGRLTNLKALDRNTGATTPLPLEDCPQRRADLITHTTYVRTCADNGRELTVVTRPLDGSPPTSTPVRLDGSGYGGRSDVALVVAPGAIVVTRKSFGGTPAPVVGLLG